MMIFTPMVEANFIKACFTIWCEHALEPPPSQRIQIVCKRIRDASVYGQKISPKFLFLSDIFLFPFVRQQVPVLAWRCSRRQRRCLVDDVRYIFKEVDALQPA